MKLVGADQHNRDVDAQTHPDNMATTKHHLSERVKLAIMLNRADLSRHKHLKDHCEDSYTMGRGEYPANTIKLLAMMKNFWQQVTTRCVDKLRVCRRGEDGLNFAQEKEEHGEYGGEQGVQMLVGVEESLPKMA